MKVNKPQRRKAIMKILHTGDLHLDSPFSTAKAEKAEEAKRELRQVFADMVAFAAKEKVSLLLIAGDLFDCGFATRETAALITSQLAKADCPVVIAPGNHDPADDNSIWNKKAFPDNVYIFDSEELSYFEFSQLGCRVYGYAFTGATMRNCPFSGMKVEDQNIVNILLAHGDTASALSAYCPITAADLLNFGADYAALGHIHSPESANSELEKKGVSAAYCGCPQGRDFGECGNKGAWLVDIEKIGEGAKVEKQFIKFAKKIYEDTTVRFDRAENTAEIISEIRTVISENGYGENTVLRIELTGNVAPGLVIVCDQLEEQCGEGLSSLTVIDNTVPALTSDELEYDRGIKGEVYRLLSVKIENGTPEERNDAISALRYALAALDGESI